MDHTAAGKPPSVGVAHVLGLSANRSNFEKTLDGAGVVLPLTQRAEWHHATGCRRGVLTVLCDDTRKPIAAVGVGVTSSRAVPGHWLYRVDRLSTTGCATTDATLIGDLTNLARRDWRCLRMTVELFERDHEARARMGQLLSGRGYSKRLPRSYTHTLALDLSPGSDALFSQLDAKVRRNVRAPAKRGLEIRAVTDVGLAHRLDALMTDTLGRAHAHPIHLPWDMIVRLSAQYPNRSRISGLFDPAVPGPEGLISFAWGAWHGSYATYEAGASVRRPDLGRTPLAYALVWDLIAWASGTHANWFDFGGVSVEPIRTPDDPFGGISEFKRYFCENTVDIGEAWVLEPRPVRASIARAVSAVARQLRAD